jgi:hypothetical protein
VLLNSFSTVPNASCPVFIFCPSGLVFGGSEGVRSRFHILRPPTHYCRCQVRMVPFSCLALPGSFFVVPRASGPVFIFCAPGFVFDGTMGVWFCFHVLRSRTHFRSCRMCRIPFSYFACPDSFSTVTRVSGHVFMFYAPGLIFGGTESV